MNRQLLTLALAYLIAGCYGADETVTVGKRMVKVTDVGGVVVTYKTDNMTNSVTLNFDSVKEIASDGTTEIGTIGGASHSFMDFSQTTFTFSAKTDETYPGTQIGVEKFSMSANLDVDSSNSLTAMLKGELYVFKAGGKVQIDGVDVLIYAGDYKFNTIVENWPFCGEKGLVCDNGQANVTGGFLDVAVKVQGTESATLASGETMVYNLGGRSIYRTSKKVMYDGSSSAQNMPSNYPRHSTRNTDDLFTARLSAFATSAKYGSVSSLGRDDVFFDKVVARPLGQSGKILYYIKDDESKKITVSFDKVAEKTAEGEAINERGHVFNTFASQSFTIDDMGMQEYQGITVKQTRFSSKLTNNPATMTVNIYLFLGDGNVANHGETYPMTAGTMKFDIEFKDWVFCAGSSCKKGQTDIIGAFLDFDIEIKGKGDQIEAKNNTDTTKGLNYDLGYGTLTLSRVILIDGQATTMADGYPKMVTKGSKKIFQFRFPKFSTMVYDPSASLNSDDDGGDGGDPNAASPVFASTAVMVIALLCSVRQLVL